ncbi:MULTISPECIES: YqjK-like family protein [unclassified Serratia (in: enterobacteria)]|uniref:YqjK-like family protein n=1 Tax=unclassified Serratia (in: enterobacteria) TaxID=2647522 RepID=UPI000500D920|nr:MULTISPECIES: YqjK-like family protein [unclassified Serratia (in: enterobacteria)]KFK95396.1 cell division protein FtsH [Serratia sp. Ag2]KFK98744.1 cell division protein FtsH [Serratia sp. Ag1]
MNRRQYREWKKQQLIQQIQQQRQDLAANKALWLDKTEYLDQGWQTLASLRKYVAIASSMVALYGIRHPGKFIRWSRRALGVWSTVRLLRKAFPAK